MGDRWSLPIVAEAVVVAIAAALSAVLVGRAWRLARRVPLNRDVTLPPGRVGRMFGAIVAVSWNSLFVAAALLGRTGHAVAIPAVVCAGVGPHFVPLARLFHVRVYHLAAVVLCGCAAVTFVVAPASAQLALWTLVPGLGAAATLYATCAALLRESLQIGDRMTSPWPG